MTKSVSETIKDLIELKKDSEKCNEKIVASHIGMTEKTFRNRLVSNEFKASEITAMADYFGVSTDRILTGSEEKNRTVAKELGLSDDAISYLKEIKSRENDYQEAFIDIAENMAYSPDELTVPADKPVIEGGTADEILYIINWLLSHPSGHNLLSMIAKYCVMDNRSAFLFDYSADTDDPFPFTECEEIYFKNRVGEGWKAVNPAVLRYALIPAITDEINKIRDEITKEVH